MESHHERQLALLPLWEMAPVAGVLRQLGCSRIPETSAALWRNLLKELTVFLPLFQRLLQGQGRLESTSRAKKFRL